MEIKIKISETHIGIAEKISFVLTGVFITCVVFALLMNTFAKTGIWLALASNIILIVAGFYYIQGRARLRLTVWGMLGSLIGITIILTASISFISNSLEGL